MTSFNSRIFFSSVKRRSSYTADFSSSFFSMDSEDISWGRYLLKSVGFCLEYSPSIWLSIFSMLSSDVDSIWKSVAWIFIEEIFLKNVNASFFFMKSSISVNFMSPVFPWDRVPVNFSKTILSRSMSLSKWDIICWVASRAFVISIVIVMTSFIGSWMFWVWMFAPSVSTIWKLPCWRSESSWKLFGYVGPGYTYLEFAILSSNLLWMCPMA